MKTEVAFERRAEVSPGDSRWQVLGALRFVLAVVVVAGHLNWFTRPVQPWIFLESLGGTAAVIGFLVVSGYSIGHSLRRRPMGFYRRRVLRIYPLYAAAILFALLPYVSGADALVAPHAAFPRPHLWVVIGNVLLLQNIVCLPIDSNMLVWTLGIEVICYLLAPVFQKANSVVLVLLVVISAAAYAMFPRLGLAHYATLRFGLPLLLFSWAWVGGFVLQRFESSIWPGVVLSGLCGVLAVLNRNYDTRFFMVTVVGCGLLVTFAPLLGVPKSLRGFCTYLGDLSYPLYLFHLPTLILGYGIFNIVNAAGLFAAVLCLAAAALFIESTLRRIFARSLARELIPTAA